MAAKKLILGLKTALIWCTFSSIERVKKKLTLLGDQEEIGDLHPRLLLGLEIKRVVKYLFPYGTRGAVFFL